MKEQTTLADPERTRHRLEILNQAFRGLLVVHGGSSIALLAFVQALEDKNPPLSRVAVVSILILVVGLILAILFMTLRYHTSLEDQRGNPNWERYRTAVFLCLYSSVAAFGISMVVFAIGVLRAL